MQTFDFLGYTELMFDMFNDIIYQVMIRFFQLQENCLETNSEDVQMSIHILSFSKIFLSFNVVI